MLPELLLLSIDALPIRPLLLCFLLFSLESVLDELCHILPNILLVALKLLTEGQLTADQDFASVCLDATQLRPFLLAAGAALLFH